jgi:hypothetical protein
VMRRGKRFFGKQMRREWEEKFMNEMVGPS